MSVVALKRKRKNEVAVLDIGTSKISCFIADRDENGVLQVKGIGHQLSKGIRAGVITDFADAETSIIAAVNDAEKMAEVTVDSVLVGLSGGGLTSRNVTVEMELLGEEVTERDLMDIIEQGRGSAGGDDAEVLHCIPVNYYLDGTKGIQDPRQMFGEKLGADLHIISAVSSITRNLAHCAARCHLNVVEFIAAPYASARVCLEEDERQLGVTLIDMGGGTTSFSIFHGGRNVYTDVIPIGGSHVTNDIAKGLSTTIAHSERLKTLHGSCIISANDDQVLINAPLLGEDTEEDESNTMPRSMLVGIIRPRMEEIFEMIRGRVEASGMEHLSGRRVVLTGGASQLIGVRELAARILGKQTRLSKPKPITGLAEAVSGPAFSCSLGMLDYAFNRPFEERLFENSRSQGLFKFKGMFGWLKKNF